MEQKAFVLTNKGMQRDLSISKTGESSAYENRNIRITATDKDTLLSVTNERGNKEVEGLAFNGELVGYGVLNSYLILFTHEEGTDYIYRVDCGAGFKSILIFSGDLGFDLEHPIETIVDYETEDIQKIYWIDGKHVLRFMNFSDSYLEKHLTSGELYNNPVFSFAGDTTWFDSNRASDTAPTVEVVKDHGGNSRENGVAQYFITYYNKNGQQTGIVYSSPLVYLAPNGRGGAGDETNTNRITLNVSGLDSTFEYIRIYQIIRTSLDTQAAAYIIGDASVIDGKAVFVDDGAHREATEASSFLFIGSQPVIANTMTQKDGTLFLGNLQSIGNKSIDELEDVVKQNSFILNGDEFTYGKDWESALVHFEYSNTKDLKSDMNHIPYVYAEGYYPYESQLEYTNAQISTFKGGEKYRFAVRFIRPDGTMSKSFWIGDKVNPYYPKMRTDAAIERSLAVCELPDAVIDAAKQAGFNSVQLMIAKATYADRSVQAQGLVCPTVFNVYDRTFGLGYSQPSWIYRPRNGGFSFGHFSVTAKSDTPQAEIQSSWWDGDVIPLPLYKEDKYGNITDSSFSPTKYKAFSFSAILQSVDGRKHGFYVFTAYYFTSLEPPSHMDWNTAVISTGQRTRSNYKQVALFWLDFYDKAGIPVTYRLSYDEIYNYVKNREDYRLPRTPFDLYSANNDRVFSSGQRQYFFVDENTLTLNSPELDEQSISIDRNAGLNFRLIGASYFTGNISDYTISADNRKYPNEHNLLYNFSHRNLSLDTDSLGAWPLFIEYGYTKQSDTEYKIIYSQYSYMMYMWHKTGGIPSYSFDNETWSTLKSKQFCNLNFSYYTAFNNYHENEWSVSPDDIRQITPLGAKLYELKHNRLNETYTVDVDRFITMPDEFKYPVFNTNVLVEPGDTLSLKEVNTVSDPIRMTYKSSPHAVVSLPSVMADTLLPYMEGDSVFESEDDMIVPWKDKTAVSDGYLMYRKVNPDSATDVKDFSKGAYGEFECLASDGGLYLRATDWDDSAFNTFDAVKDIIAEKNVSSAVYVIAKDTTGKFWFVDTRSAKAISTNITAKYYQLSKSVHVTVTSTDISMKEVTVTMYKKKTSITDEILSEYTSKFATNQSEFAYNVDVPNNLFTVRIGVSIKYAGTYIDSDKQKHKLIPDFELPFADRLTVAADSSTKIDCNHIAAFSDALYIDPTDLTSYIDPTDTTSVLKFVNIAATPRYEYQLSKEGIMTCTGLYKYTYKKPDQKLFKLEHSELYGNKYLFVGELYKDYDALPIEQDTRYGGITEQAVEGNTFVTAGPQKLLSDTDVLSDKPVAVIDCSDLYRYITEECVFERNDFNVTLSKAGRELETITLPSLNALTLDEVLPTSNVKTDKFTVVKTDAGYCSAIEGLPETRMQQIRSSSDYKVCILRYGYARRGKFRMYINKYGQEQSTHTDRVNYREKRVGEKGTLDAKRYRVIGYDLLISSKNLEQLQKAHSSTWVVDSGRIDYTASTLVSALGDALVLPEVRKRTLELTVDGRYADKSRDGIIELYAGLYHREQGTWVLVSNVVKVRGRNKANTQIWEFTDDNIKYDTENTKKDSEENIAATA